MAQHLIPMVRQPGSKVPTHREINALLAIGEYPDMATASEAIGTGEQSLKNLLASLRKKLGVSTNVQAYHRLSSGLRVKVVTETTIERMS